MINLLTTHHAWASMFDPNQLDTPDSFATLFIEPGQERPSLSREALFARFEFCDDLACTLSENAAAAVHGSGIGETDVLERFYAGLLSKDSGISEPEASWIIHRVLELLDWPFELSAFIGDTPAPGR